MTIQERLKRREVSDIIYIGSLVERVCFKEDAKPTEFLELLKALTEGRAEQEALMSKEINADRILGRIEMAYKLVNDLEQFVADKDAVNIPKSEPDDLSETILASEPSGPKMGGTV